MEKHKTAGEFCLKPLNSKLAFLMGQHVKVVRQAGHFQESKMESYEDFTD